jgi:hypothetical protein
MSVRVQRTIAPRAIATAAALASTVAVALAQVGPAPRAGAGLGADLQGARSAVEVLTIDTRNTGVDLGLQRLPDGTYAPRARGAAMLVAQPDAPSSIAPVTNADSAPATGAGVPMPPPAAADQAAGHAGNGATDPADETPGTGALDAAFAPGAGAAPGPTEPLDAPLAAQGMSLDAVTAAAAAEASRNRNGTLVRGRITPAP